MKILIIGANSYVGARIFLELSKKYKTVGTYYNNKLSNKFVQLDITDRISVARLINKYKPDIIVHVANNSSAKWCNENKNLAKKLNVNSTKYIVDAANLINAKVIYISSFAAIAHNDIYGKTKFSSENIVKKTKAGYSILRLSTTYGFSPNTENDRPFNRLLKNLYEQKTAVYDISWKSKTTYLKHVCEVIEKIIEEDIWNDIIPVATEGLKSRYTIAKDILGHFNVKVTPVNNHDTTAINREDLSKLKKLGLPTYTYSQIKKKIIKEIESSENFKL